MIGLFTSYFNVVLCILDFLTRSFPGVAVAFFANGYFHTVFKGRIAFEQIQDVESNFSCSFVVVNTKKEPLSASSSIYIFLKQQIILVVIVCSDSVC